MEEPKPKKKNAPLTAIAVTTTIGTELAITVLIGFYGGRLLDRQLGTEPWFLVGGVLAGVALGIFGIIQTVQRFFKN
ncbi:Putative F0F1-ATPase subunit Ca2+/Mg2+ transporter [Desulfotomaculum arcticum]|uniref:Putative F0F1-ATPase subunit Ca2+/Mg2+ transporter n=1 Tax=Desulfotruncus arcticus DSM 17038 TaxID=1121424 RepID=A0A1I2WZN8_9FIRM|nr:AtpZ/AtpI family protein [Desulfotruncus arcticus]SFH06217.1 Putative F0F1-ATPase subunit Ca2+/Mg2+ transporter [Desulfotomaculum arcticum] [Desulfotruncus arcticus DSM 17038]